MHLLKHFATRISAGLLAATALITPAFAASGTVNSAEGLNLRSGASTSAAILTTLRNGVQVEILGTVEGGWYQVSYQGATGYVFGDYLTVSAESAQEADDSVYIKVVDGPLNVRSEPSTSGAKTSQLSTGAVVQTAALANGWYQLSSGGYVCADYVTVVDASEANSSNLLGIQIAAYAQQFLGCRYASGGSSPSGFDCSGLTSYVYAHFGISLTRTSYGQINNGTAVSKSELQPGDLVFFKASSTGRISHVGIYIGGGQIIHAATAARGVVLDSLYSTYYVNHYAGACRVV